ncbi:Inner membrane protein YrbG, predicted calcium/sodium:proton antiporter [hydrothermal vent metagenome]|uniref:Inner membrane protein YrbG, predicted calcium/sodium:proton antiporter n=1 Tax=hydrothermal vent metagenome TaxID=652676 RepID=A0A3B1CPT6_9ZZZZ
MSVLTHVAVIVGTILALWGGAVWVVESASRIAKKFGLSQLVIGLTVVAIGTSAPEFAVSISAALSGKLSISVGNVVGSNIFNLGIILGFVAILSSVKTDKTLLYRDGSLLVIVGLILVLFFYDLELSLFEGILLVSTLLIYIFMLLRSKTPIEEEIPEGDFSWKDIPMLIIGIAFIVGGAHYLVESASTIARHFGISEWMIGITIVAAGTSIPEFATSVVAIVKGKQGISIGNLIGSDIFNLLGVLGVASIIRPLEISQSDYYSIVILSVYLILLFAMMRFRWKIGKVEGTILILLAIFRWWIVTVV